MHYGKQALKLGLASGGLIFTAIMALGIIILLEEEAEQRPDIIRPPKKAGWRSRLDELLETS